MIGSDALARPSLQDVPTSYIGLCVIGVLFSGYHPLNSTPMQRTGSEPPRLVVLSRFGATGQQATSYRAFGLPGARVLPMLCTVHASMLRMGWDGQNGLVLI